MRMLLVVALIVVCAGAVFGQTAQVIELTPNEAKQAATLYAEKAAVEAKIEALRNALTSKYVMVRTLQVGSAKGWVDCGPGGCLPVTRPEWLNGFVYSTDFKFIVPASSLTFQIGGAGCTTPISTGGYFVNPLTTAPLSVN
jgi:hypothetical protein